MLDEAVVVYVCADAAEGVGERRKWSEREGELEESGGDETVSEEL